MGPPLQLINQLYDCSFIKNSSVGRASVQWGGRPRPPTDMAARDGRPTNTSHFSFFFSGREKLIVGITTVQGDPPGRPYG
jgi:hypothetical protein